MLRSSREELICARFRGSRRRGRAPSVQLEVGRPVLIRGFWPSGPLSRPGTQPRQSCRRPPARLRGLEAGELRHLLNNGHFTSPDRCNCNEDAEAPTRYAPAGCRHAQNSALTITAARTLLSQHVNAAQGLCRPPPFGIHWAWEGRTGKNADRDAPSWQPETRDCCAPASALFAKGSPQTAPTVKRQLTT